MQRITRKQTEQFEDFGPAETLCLGIQPRPRGNIYGVYVLGDDSIPSHWWRRASNFNKDRVEISDFRLRLGCGGPWPPTPLMPKVVLLTNRESCFGFHGVWISLLSEFVDVPSLSHVLHIDFVSCSLSSFSSHNRVAQVRRIWVSLCIELHMNSRSRRSRCSLGDSRAENNLVALFRMVRGFADD